MHRICRICLTLVNQFDLAIGKRRSQILVDPILVYKFAVFVEPVDLPDFRLAPASRLGIPEVIEPNVDLHAVAEPVNHFVRMLKAVLSTIVFHRHAERVSFT